MKNFVLMTVIATICSAGVAYADAHYADGTYRCKNRKGLPDNVYSVRSLTVDSAQIPFVEATRYFRRDSANPNSPVQEARISGLAAVSAGEDSTALMVAALRLEFRDRKLIGCEQ